MMDDILAQFKEGKNHLLVLKESNHLAKLKERRPFPQFKKQNYLIPVSSSSKVAKITKNVISMSRKYVYEDLRPLKLEELYLLYRIDKCRENSKILIGDGPLTDQMRVLLLQHVYRLMNVDVFYPNKPNPFVPLPPQFKTFIFLCQTKKQKESCQKLAEKQCCLLYRRYKDQLRMKLNFVYCFGRLSLESRKLEAKKRFDINKQTTLQRYKYIGHIPRDFDFGTEVNRQIIVATIQEYAQYLISTPPDDIQHADFLFMEPSSLQKFTQNAFHLQINQTIIRRALIQHKKLQKFYNFRLNKGQHDEINALYYKLKEMIKKNNSNHSSAKSYHPPDLSLDDNFLECKYLLNLSFVGYLINSLIAEERQLKLKRSNHIPPISSKEYIKDISNKLLVGKTKIKEAHQILKDMLEDFPPQIGDLKLETQYILKICSFFQRIIVWDELFDQKYPKFLQIIKQKTPESYSIQTACFQHKILFQLMISKCRSAAIIHSILPPQYLFDMVFKLGDLSQKIIYSRNQITQMLEEQERKEKQEKQRKQRKQMKQIQLLNKNKSSGKEQLPLLIRQKTSYIQAFKEQQRKQQKPKLTGLIISLTSSEEDLFLPPVQYLEENAKMLQNKTSDHETISQIIQSYAQLVFDICQKTTDGIIIYFGCREHLLMCRKQWEEKDGIYKKIAAQKIIFQQSLIEEENEKNVKLYKKYNDIGRGAIYFISAVGPLATYQKFPDHYSNCVIFISLPTLSAALTAAKLSYLQLKNRHKFDLGLSIVTKCLNNCISAPDYPKTVVFAGSQFRNEDVSDEWCPFVQKLNLTTGSILLYIQISIQKTSPLYICENDLSKLNQIKKEKQNSTDDSQGDYKNDAQTPIPPQIQSPDTPNTIDPFFQSFFQSQRWP